MMRNPKIEYKGKLINRYQIDNITLQWMKNESK